MDIMLADTMELAQASVIVPVLVPEAALVNVENSTTMAHMLEASVTALPTKWLI